jgi:hypothetical protein
VALDLDQLKSELDAMFESISYELTTARTAGVADPEALRVSLRRIRGLVAEADSLAGHVVAERAAGER